MDMGMYFNLRNLWSLIVFPMLTDQIIEPPYTELRIKGKHESESEAVWFQGVGPVELL